jgi:methionyl-tRNA formyltransferase
MGSPEFAVPSLEHLAADGYDIAAVYTTPDRPAGRGKILAESPVKKAAAALGLPVIQPEKLKSPDVISQLAAFHPATIIVAAYGLLLPRAVLEIPHFGCINIHPSLLPRHRGAAPIPAAIIAGDQFTGVTIMKMDEGLDSGPILVQAQIPVSDEDNTGTLTQKLAIAASFLIEDALIQWVTGEITPRPQSGADISYSREQTKEAGEIDWKRSAAEIWRQVRAYQPWPGAYTLWGGKRLEIIRGFPLPWPETIEPGQVADMRRLSKEAAFGIGTGDGVLGVCKVQLEGKKAVPAIDFMRGQRGFLGSKVSS